MSKNCTEFNFNLYFALEDIFKGIIDRIPTDVSGKIILSDNSVSSILMDFRNKVKEQLGLEVSSDKVKEFIEVSSLLSKDEIDKIINGSEIIPTTTEIVIPEDTKAEAVQTEAITQKEKENPETAVSDKSDINLSRSTVIKLGSVKPINDANDLYENYFSKSFIAYDMFIKSVGKNMFKNTFVSFDKNNSYLVDSNQQVNNNMFNYINKLKNELSTYFEVENNADIVKEVSDKLTSFSNLDLNDAIKQNQNSPLVKAYFAYVTLVNFDKLVNLFVPTLSIDKKAAEGSGLERYKLNIHHKLKNNYSDSLVNMMDELSDIVKSMIEFTPALDENGEEINGKFLKNSAVIKIAGDLKDQSQLILNSAEFKVAMKLRMNPEIGAGDLMRYILTTKSAQGNFTKEDLMTMRSLYNFYYKREEDNFKGLNPNTVSLLQIKQNEFNKKERVFFNSITDSITTLIDKTISQQYMTMKETADGFQRVLTKHRNIDKFYITFINQLNKNINSDSNVSDNVIFNEQLVSIKAGNQVFKVNATSPTNNITVVDEFEALDSKEWQNFNNGDLNGLTQKKLNYATTVKTLSDMLGITTYQLNGELINAIPYKPKEIVENLARLAGVSEYYKKIKSEFKDEKNDDPNLTLSSFITYKGYKVAENSVDANSFIPFTKWTGNINFFTMYANANATSKGEVSSAVSRNNNGDGLPNSSLVNLIGDDMTSIERIVDSPDGFAVKDNLFAQNKAANFKSIKGTVYRQDIETKDRLKAAKKLNAGEVTYYSIFYDFFLNMTGSSNKNQLHKVMIEPTVCSDKSPQPMKVYDLNEKIQYKGLTKKFNGKNAYELYRDNELKSLHFETMKKQYTGFYEKLMSDYKFIFKNMSERSPEKFNEALKSAKLGNDFSKYSIFDFEKLVVATQKQKLKMEKFNKGTEEYLENGVLVQRPKKVDVQLEFHYVKGGINETLLAKFKEYEVIKGYEGSYNKRMEKEHKKFLKSFSDVGINIPVLNQYEKLTPDFKNILTHYNNYILGKNESELEKTIEDFLKNWVDSSGHLISHKFSDGSNREITFEDVYDENTKIQMNPLLDFFNQVYNSYNSNYLLATVGGAHAHKIKTSKAKEIKMLKNPKNPQHNIYQIVTKKYGTELGEQILWEEIAESTRTIAMHKRMVAMMAKFHPFTKGSIDGMVRHMKTAVISDISKTVGNSIGDSTGFDVADGSGWVTMTAAVHYRHSMSSMGTDTHTLKTIRHHLDPDTGCAQLDKHAIQTISNEVMRRSSNSFMNMEVINRKAMDAVKFSEVFLEDRPNLFDSKYSMFGNKIHPEASAAIDENGILTVDPSSVENLILPSFLGGQRIRYSEEGTGIIGETLGIGFLRNTGQYVVKCKFTDLNSEPAFPLESGFIKLNDNGEYYKIINLNSNYDIWQNVLGGKNSIEESDADTTHISTLTANYSYTDLSHELLATIQNSIVIKKDSEITNQLRKKGIKTESPSETNPNLLNQANYYQPLKNALIWQLNNASGIKNGARNVNDSSMWYSDDDIPLNYYETETLHYGVQGNFDHAFSEEHEASVREASQVTSLIEANGFMHKDTTRLYNALATVVENSLKVEREAILKGNKEVSLMLTKTLIKVMSTRERLGLGQAYASKVEAELKKLQDAGKLTPETFRKYKLAFSDPNFYKAMISMISGALNSRAIQRELPGLGAILSQCHDVIMVTDNADGSVSFADSLIKNKNAELVKKYRTELSEGITENYLAELKDFKLRNGATYDPSNITNFNNISIEDNLRIDNGLGYGFNFKIETAEQYYELQNKGIEALNGVKKTKDGYFVGENKVAELDQQFNVMKVKNAPRNLKPNMLSFKTLDENGNELELNELDFDASKAAWAFVTLRDSIKEISENPEAIKNLSKTLNNYNYLKPFLGKDVYTGFINSDPDEVYLSIVKESQNQYKAAQNGVFRFNGKDYIGTGEVIPGEVILPNYNFFKFGIKVGMTIDQVNKDYFRKINQIYSDGKSKNILDNDFKYSSFYLINPAVKNENGNPIDFNHTQLIHADSFKNLSDLNIKKEEYRTKVINDIMYFVDESNNIVAEYDENLEFFTSGKNNIIVYKNIDQVHKLASSGRYLGIGYNFKNDTKIIRDYINEYDLKNKKYVSNLSDKPNSSEISQTIKTYNADKYNRFDKFIDEIDQSWSKQIKIIGARIPAQAFQSVMAMKVVGFTEKLVNRAYVPIKKNYLDGSDFDIDKIYMMGFSVNKYGKLNTHTDYFDYLDVEKSFEMPFPDGKNRDFTNEDSGLNVHLINRYVNNLFYGGETEDGILKLAFSETVEYLNIVSKMDSIPSKGLSDEAKEYVQKFFKDQITDQNRLLEASKNVAMTALYKASNAVVNLMAGHRGVDMNDPQAGATKSPKLWQSKQFSMDNYMTIPLMKEENAAGKDVIGISAVGMKVFYALSHFYNSKVREFEQRMDKINTEDKESSEYLDIKSEFKKLINPKEFVLYDEITKTDKKYISTFLANVNFDNCPKVNELYSEIIEELQYTTSNYNGVEKVISGAQTGIDQLGLKVAKGLNIKTGGTAPRGFKTDNAAGFTVDELINFDVQEITEQEELEHWERLGKNKNNDFTARTYKNVKDSDGTIYFSNTSDSAGLKATQNFANAEGKPFLLNPTSKEEIIEWLAQNNIKTLNVAGNRGSKSSNKFITNAETLLTSALSSTTEDRKLRDFQVLDTREIKDTSLILSAMVSAATDNAKELILAKINAGPELAGTYVYMIMQGLSFDSITDFMVSPTVDAIVKTSKSDIFENKENTIDTAISYFLTGVPVKNFLNQKQIDTINYYMMVTNGKYDTVDKVTGETKNPFIDLLTDEGKQAFIYQTEAKDGKPIYKMKQLGNNLQTYFYYLKEGSLPKFLELMESKKFFKNGKFVDDYKKVDFNELFSNDTFDFADYSNFSMYEDDTERIGINIALNRLLKEVKKRDTVLKSLGTSSEEFTDVTNPILKKVSEFSEIYKDAQESKAFGTRLGINGGMATDLYGQYRYYRSIATFINSKLNPEMAISFEEDNRQDLLNSGCSDIIDLLDMRAFHQTVFSNDLEKEQNKLRRKLLIKLYSLVQSKFNIVQAESELPHFDAMMGVHSTTMDIFTGASLRYDYTLKLMDQLYEKELIPMILNGKLHSFNEDAVNGISNFILTDLVMGFFKNKKYEIQLPDGVSYYTKDFKIKTSQGNSIDLSTPHGKASFKLFMEEYLKSELQRENPNNEFLQNLVFEEAKDPLDGNTYSFLKMNMDMSSIKSDLDRFRFQNYLVGYSATKDMSTADLGYPVTVNGKPSKTSVGDLFMLYNLLINNNAFGKNTLTKLLEADLSKKQDTLITEFFSYMGTVDSLKNDPTKNFYPLDLVDVNKLAILIAPKVTKNDLNKYISKYVKVYNPELKKFELYQYEKKVEKSGFSKGIYKLMDGGQIHEGIPSKLYFTDANISGTESNLLSLFSISDKLVEEFKNGNLNINIEC